MKNLVRFVSKNKNLMFGLGFFCVGDFILFPINIWVGLIFAFIGLCFIRLWW